MSYIASLREYFHYQDWARDKLMTVASTLVDRSLDQAVEMGEGSLRATLRHLYGSERTWLERWRGVPQAELPRARALTAPGEMWPAFRALAAARNEDLAALRDEDVRRTTTYAAPDGKTYTHALGDILLHVCNHGTHHRAQAVNMLRKLEAALPSPGLDYIFMKLEEATAAPPALSVDLLRRYFEYGDWACRRAHASAAHLTDEQLDRPFEVGLGTLRRTLGHIQDGERWWFENWTAGPGRLFPEAAPQISIAELTRRGDETRTARDRFLATLADGDLLRSTSATPRAGVLRTFPLGVTMLQLCCHGVHHRAQALNMLRHVGAEVPALDYIVWIRTGGGAASDNAGHSPGRDDHGRRAN